MLELERAFAMNILLYLFLQSLVHLRDGIDADMMGVAGDVGKWLGTLECGDVVTDYLGVVRHGLVDGTTHSLEPLERDTRE